MDGRRRFVLCVVPLAGAAFMLPKLTDARDFPALTETDPMGVTLGFKLDTTKANQAKFPTHTNEQSCASCIHFMKPGAAVAQCDVFNRLVPKRGWCIGYWNGA
jgi:hypothetical protein